MAAPRRCSFCSLPAPPRSAPNRWWPAVTSTSRDFCGTLRGNTAFLTGRAGFGTDRGIFVMVNAIEQSGNVDHDGYTPAPGVAFNNLAVVDTQDFINLANPARFIWRTNFVLADFLIRSIRASTTKSPST